MSGSLPSTSRKQIFAWCIGIGILLTALLLIRHQLGGSSAKSQLELAGNPSTDPFKALQITQSLIRSANGYFPAAQILECRLLLGMNRLRETRELFARIRRLQDCNPGELCEFAAKAQAVGELSMAGQALLAAGELVRRDPYRLKLLIYTLYQQQGADQLEDLVLELCEEYAQLAPDDAFPWLVSSSLYHERGVPNLAVQAYREALKRELPPEETYRVRLHLAELELLLGELAQARQHCNALRAETEQPQLMKVVTALHAEILHREGKAGEARSLLDELLEKNPEWVQARSLRGKCRFDLGDLPGAISDLSAAVRVNDFDQQSHYVLGKAYLMQKNEQLANLHLNRSRELNELMAQIFTLENQLRNDLGNREIKLRLAELNEKHGDFEKAAAWRRGAEKLLKIATH